MQQKEASAQYTLLMATRRLSGLGCVGVSYCRCGPGANKQKCAALCWSASDIKQHKFTYLGSQLE